MREGNPEAARTLRVARLRPNYVAGDGHTNAVESLYSVFTSCVEDACQHCYKKRLHHYVAEFDIRHSN